MGCQRQRRALLIGFLLSLDLIEEILRWMHSKLAGALIPDFRFDDLRTDRQLLFFFPINCGKVLNRFFPIEKTDFAVDRRGEEFPF